MVTSRGQCQGEHENNQKELVEVNGNAMTLALKSQRMLRVVCYD